MRSRGALIVGAVVAIAHLCATVLVFVSNDYHHRAVPPIVPILWRVVSFPLVPLEVWLAKGRDWPIGPVDAFFWSWLVNSLLWGVCVTMAAGWLRRRNLVSG